MENNITGGVDGDSIVIVNTGRKKTDCKQLIIVCIVKKL
jgi:hypothetical protein